MIRFGKECNYQGLRRSGGRQWKASKAKIENKQLAYILGVKDEKNGL